MIIYLDDYRDPLPTNYVDYELSVEDMSHYSDEWYEKVKKEFFNWIEEV